MNDVDWNDLRRSHLENLALISARLSNNGRLKEHFEHLKNSMDSREAWRAEKEKSKKIRINENVINESHKKSKSFDIDWNLEYCNWCKLCYWPSNVRVYILPKFGISRPTSRLFTRHKSLGFTPKFKSFKYKLLKNVANRSMKLIYECRRCRARNLIVKELNRPAPKLIPIDPKRENNRPNKKLKVPVIVKRAPEVIRPMDSNKSRDKKFKSLQAKLKHSELQQEMAKKSSIGSLADFLQKLN